MRNIIVFLVILLVVPVTSVIAKDVTLSMAYTNALGKELPFTIFSKKSWSPDPQARYVKLHLYFDEPILVKGLEIDTCGTEVDPGISIFFNFDQWILHIDPSLSGTVPDSVRPKMKGNFLVLEGFKKTIEVRSLTFNFERSQAFRICGINLKDPQGDTYNIKEPTLVVGSVAASSTLAPQTAYDPIFLFDSRFEYGWASNKQAKDVNLVFNFEQPQRIEKFRIWNGYQRSVNHCQSNSRARMVKVTGDNGYTAEIGIRDILGSQVVALPQPYVGKQLKFEIIDSFPGKTYKDLVISELRFFDGKDWFMLDPTLKLQQGIAANRVLFAKAKAGILLNDSFVGQYEYKEDNATKYYTDSTLRLRADGSFYISNAIGGEPPQYFALGNYEIKEADAKKGMRLRLFGLYYQSEAYGDCNGCGRDCNKNDDPEGPVQKIFQEFVTIKLTGPDTFIITNESGGQKLPFEKFRLIRETEVAKP